MIFTEASVCIFCREFTRPYNSVVYTHISLYSIFFSTSYRGRLDHDHMVVFLLRLNDLHRLSSTNDMLFAQNNFLLRLRPVTLGHFL
jgi:hypothetical protein